MVLDTFLFLFELEFTFLFSTADVFQVVVQMSDFLPQNLQLSLFTSN